MYEFCWRHRVEFAETDMAGIVHFANYFRYMEMAEHAFLRSLGLSVHGGRGTPGAVSWPRIKAECAFKAPLTFEDELEVHLVVREKSRKTIAYGHRIVRADGVLAAEGGITVICVTFDPSGRMTSIPIPPEIDAKITPAPP